MVIQPGEAPFFIIPNLGASLKSYAKLITFLFSSFSNDVRNNTETSLLYLSGNIKKKSKKLRQCCFAKFFFSRGFSKGVIGVLNSNRGASGNSLHYFVP